MAQHGDPKLTDLLETLANCTKARSASIHDRCKAVYSGLDLDEGQYVGIFPNDEAIMARRRNPIGTTNGPSRRTIHDAGNYGRLER